MTALKTDVTALQARVVALEAELRWTSVKPPCPEGAPDAVTTTGSRVVRLRTCSRGFEMVALVHMNDVQGQAKSFCHTCRNSQFNSGNEGLKRG